MQIYILLYKEVALALKINSVYSKKKLLSIHENVRVLRYPDHFSTGVYLWYGITENLVFSLYGLITNLYFFSKKTSIILHFFGFLFVCDYYIQVTP